MDKEILDLLTEMNKEMKSMKSEMHSRFDTIETKLEVLGASLN
ncbi:hypothetical protein GCM10009001_01400 [Virgibacillus siamensis]|uniref:Degradation enzyme regulation protein DegQ n=1 Tax=Virgibacillus siamensis TaxID=480071 RepID=A0ABP3QH74_9BACI